MEKHQRFSLHATLNKKKIEIQQRLPIRQFVKNAVYVRSDLKKNFTDGRRDISEII